MRKKRKKVKWGGTVNSKGKGKGYQRKEMMEKFEKNPVNSVAAAFRGRQRFTERGLGRNWFGKVRFALEGRLFRSKVREGPKKNNVREKNNNYPVVGEGGWKGNIGRVKKKGGGGWESWNFKQLENPISKKTR